MAALHDDPGHGPMCMGCMGVGCMGVGCMGMGSMGTPVCVGMAYVAPWGHRVNAQGHCARAWYGRAPQRKMFVPHLNGCVT